MVFLYTLYTFTLAIHFYTLYTLPLLVDKIPALAPTHIFCTGIGIARYIFADIEARTFIASWKHHGRKCECGQRPFLFPDKAGNHQFHHLAQLVGTRHPPFLHYLQTMSVT